MTVTALNDIHDLYNVSSDAIKENLLGKMTSGSEKDDNMFQTIFDSAVHNINETNGYLSDQENEEMKWAMGITENTHDLAIAMNKAETALQYTVAVRDKLLAAYNEIMQIQI